MPKHDMAAHRFHETVKLFLPPILIPLLHRLNPLRQAQRGLPDAALYQPMFHPWRGGGEFAAITQEIAPITLVTKDRCWVLYTLARQALARSGGFFEAGVYQGGTAVLLHRVLKSGSARELHLFDTFTGMPKPDAKFDSHQQGDFGDTSLEAVQALFAGDPAVQFHPGLVPDSFAGLEGERFAFAHIDLDIYHSILDCCAYLYPRMVAGGFMVFDDYGMPSCPGARAAVDQFFADKPEQPLALYTGQAVVFCGGTAPAD